MFRADFPCFTLKIVEHSRYLLPTLAVMHKLLRILLGLYKHPGAYDATKALPTHVHTLELEAVAA